MSPAAPTPPPPGRPKSSRGFTTVLTHEVFDLDADDLPSAARPLPPPPQPRRACGDRETLRKSLRLACLLTIAGLTLLAASPLAINSDAAQADALGASAAPQPSPAPSAAPSASPLLPLPSSPPRLPSPPRRPSPPACTRPGVAQGAAPCCALACVESREGEARPVCRKACAAPPPPPQGPTPRPPGPTPLSPGPTPPPPGPTPPPQRPAPPPPRPPASGALVAAVGAINRRFTRGGPSDAWGEAGVLVHQFDLLEDWGNGRPWAPCHSGWCAALVDHLSCSLLNAKLKQMYKTDRAGVILAPHAAARVVLCAYTNDGGTQSVAHGGCHTVPPCEGRVWWGCTWTPDRLGEMLTAKEANGQYGYNEIIADAVAWEDALPELIEAFFFVGGHSDAKAVEAHRQFLQAFPERRIPLVRFDSSNRKAPFTLIE